MDELGAIVDEIKANDAIKGVVITSGKETFSGGADLNMLDRMLGEFRAAVAAGHREEAVQRLYTETFRLGDLFRRIETCGKPVVAAINGTCLGGAFELALSCHGRIAADGDKVRMGLPEVRVGLLPGAGGTQRVARLVNTQDALTMLLKGEQLKPARAKALGLLDAVVPADDLDSGGEAVAQGDAAEDRAVGRGRVQGRRRRRSSRRRASTSGRRRTPSTARRPTTTIPARARCSPPCSRGCNSPSTRRSGSSSATSPK